MLLFLIATLACVFLQALFALFEMSSLSLSRIRLEYLASQGRKRAVWLLKLLEQPSRFFGTALIGINAALQVGSECSRRFYEKIHLDPDWSPLTQVFIVVILAELVPMFVARRHPSIALSLTPFMALISRFFQPFIVFFDFLSRATYRLMGLQKQSPHFVSREELLHAFEEEGHDELQDLTRRVFQLKNLAAGALMIPLVSVPASATLEEVQSLLGLRYTPLIAIYKGEARNIIATVHTRDLLRLAGEQPILDKGRSPWFITQDASILSILEQFRRNQQSVAIVLDSSGHACGMLTLDQILSRIFGEEPKGPIDEAHSIHIERTLPGEMEVRLFNREFQASLPLTKGETLSDLVVAELGHLPGAGEEVTIASFVFTVVEPTMLGVKTLSVHSD